VRLGLLKTSLIDYPGHVAAVLFTPGCDFRCPYCQNPALVQPEPGCPDGLLPVGEVLSFLQRRRGVLSAVVVSGGEPCMHEGLPDLLASIRVMGYLVKVDTNGSYPDRMKRIEADYLAMDLKSDPGRYHELWPDAPPDAAERIRESVCIVRRSGAGYEYRITCAPGYVDEAAARAIATLLEPADRVFLQRYKPATVLDPAWAGSVSPYTDARMAELLAIFRQTAPLARIRGA
jgi:pyruvate formate lyase activating enzyme